MWHLYISTGWLKFEKDTRTNVGEDLEHILVVVV